MSSKTWALEEPILCSIHWVNESTVKSPRSRLHLQSFNVMPLTHLRLWALLARLCFALLPLLRFFRMPPTGLDPKVAPRKQPKAADTRTFVPHSGSIRFVMQLSRRGEGQGCLLEACYGFCQSRRQFSNNSFHSLNSGSFMSASALGEAELWKRMQIWLRFKLAQVESTASRRPFWRRWLDRLRPAVGCDVSCVQLLPMVIPRFGKQMHCMCVGSTVVPVSCAQPTRCTQFCV